MEQELLIQIAKQIIGRLDYEETEYNLDRAARPGKANIQWIPALEPGTNEWVLAGSGEYVRLVVCDYHLFCRHYTLKVPEENTLVISSGRSSFIRKVDLTNLDFMEDVFKAFDRVW